MEAEGDRRERPFPHDVAMPEAYYLIEPAAQARTPATRASTEWVQMSVAGEGR